MRPHSIIRTLAAAALIAVPSIAMAAPDQNTNGNNNTCRGGQWINGQCVYNNNNNNNNGQWNNNGRHRDRDDNNDRHRDRDDNNDRDDHRDNGRHNGWNNPNNPHNGNNGNYNGGYNNGTYNNGTYNYGNNGNNGRNGNWNYGRGNQLTGTVSSFSPFNLYLNNGQHVELHNGTVINPTGTNLSPGMRVRVIGARNSDGTFNANEIDVVGSGYRYLR